MRLTFTLSDLPRIPTSGVRRAVMSWKCSSRCVSTCPKRIVMDSVQRTTDLNLRIDLCDALNDPNEVAVHH